MFLQNTSRTAATVDPKLSVAKAPTLKLKWASATGGPIATSACIVGTTAYVGSWDGYEYAINTQTGAVIWKPILGITTDPGCTPSTIGITSSAAVVNGVLYVGGGGSLLVRARRRHRGHPVEGLHRRQQPGRAPTTTGPARSS